MKRILIIATLLLSACAPKVGEFHKLQRRVNDLDKRVSQLEQQYSYNVDLINALDNGVDSLYSVVEALQSTQNDLAMELAALAGYKHIVGFIDPCEDGPGFDEVLVQLSDGSLLAYFESGHKRFLSLLSPGNYRTTDAQGCYFSVDNNGDIVF